MICDVALPASHCHQLSQTQVGAGGTGGTKGHAAVIFNVSPPRIMDQQQELNTMTADLPDSCCSTRASLRAQSQAGSKTEDFPTVNDSLEDTVVDIEQL